MKNEAAARANGDEILRQIERGLTAAGIDGRVIDATMEVHRQAAPIRAAQSGGVIEYLDMGSSYTLTLKIDVKEVRVLDMPVAIADWGVAVSRQGRAIARAGEEV